MFKLLSIVLVVCTIAYATAYGIGSSSSSSSSHHSPSVGSSYDNYDKYNKKPVSSHHDYESDHYGYNKHDSKHGSESYGSSSSGGYGGYGKPHHSSGHDGNSYGGSSHGSKYGSGSASVHDSHRPADSHWDSHSYDGSKVHGGHNYDYNRGSHSDSYSHDSYGKQHGGYKSQKHGY